MGKVNESRSVDALNQSDAMWYVVHLLFCRNAPSKKSLVMCASCQVLFQAHSALQACGKAESWAEIHARETGFKILGIEHVHKLDDERLGDGTEIGGRFFQKRTPWGQRKKLIPGLSEIPTVRFELNRKTPIKDLLSKKQIAHFKRVFRKK